MRLGLLVVCVVFGLAACAGGGDEAGSVSSPDSASLPSGPDGPVSEKPAEPAGPPSCGEVWVDGATLPAKYDGCVRPDGSIEAAVVYDCDSGIGRFTGYDDRFFALLGGKITEAGSDSPEYGAAYEECFADG